MHPKCRRPLYTGTPGSWRERKRERENGEREREREKRMERERKTERKTERKKERKKTWPSGKSIGYLWQKKTIITSMCIVHEFLFLKTMTERETHQLIPH